MWVENLADDIGATLMDYAVSRAVKCFVGSVCPDFGGCTATVKQSGACTDLSLWPSAIRKVDFVGQSECIRSPCRLS